MLSVPYCYLFSVNFVSLCCSCASPPSFCFLNAVAVCLFTHLHPLERAWILVRVSALQLVLEEMEGCPQTIALAYCSLLILRVKLFKIKILLLHNFSIWGFPQSFPEADGASWTCARRALRFLQCCLLPTKPAVSILPPELPGSRKARVQALLLFWCQPAQRLCIVNSLTRMHPEDVSSWQGQKNIFWFKKLNCRSELRLRLEIQLGSI